MENVDLVFVTVPEDVLDDLDIDEDVLLDWGTTDREGDGYLVLLYGQEARSILTEDLRPLTFRLRACLKNNFRLYVSLQDAKKRVSIQKAFFNKLMVPLSLAMINIEPFY